MTRSLPRLHAAAKRLGAREALRLVPIRLTGGRGLRGSGAPGITFEVDAAFESVMRSFIDRWPVGQT